MRMIKTVSKKENGSIMLEVVAVLALMGVMGAMLFRQIYQRNQELHNIQMASEIRTVKEAFSAYIQANRSFVLSACPTPPSPDDVVGCTVATLYEDVADYLPDGWFTAAELESAYTLTLWNYMQNDDSNRRIVYGVIVPNAGTLPTTGWNFRRAARVALLIGADGGAFNRTITNGHIAGALGSWEIVANGIVESDCLSAAGDDKPQCSTYVATTGIDIFAPEYEAPEGKVKIPENWNLALQNLHAFNYFSVGSSGTGNCYTAINHNRYVGTSPNEELGSDDVTTALTETCKPLFWVGDVQGGPFANNGQVYVATDLNVGGIASNRHDGSLKLTAEGAIKQKSGLTIDKDGRLISSDKIPYSTIFGELQQNEQYVLDLGHTSTMNDIRLASRGGARLSDILPNYILKDVVSINFDDEKTVPVPVCPSKYKAAVTVVPVTWDNRVGTATVSFNNGKLSDTEVTGTVTTSPNVSGNVTHDDVTGNVVLTNTGVDNPSNLSITTPTKVVTSITEGLCVSIKYNTESSYTHEGLVKGKDPSGSSTKNWKIIMGYRNTNGNCVIDNTNAINGHTSGIYAVVHTYCVWEPTLYATQAACESAGYKWSDSGKCGVYLHHNDENWDALTSSPEMNEDRCTANGFSWTGNSTDGRCVFTYVIAADINNTSKVNKKFIKSGSTTETDAEVLIRRAAVCKAAGYEWNQCSATAGCCHEVGSTCSCS